ncbi:MAG TPA: SDR family oxidoreductase [Candidatus Omnitrophota bacterium]|nr:SDR family oxidoreductase [Candidatus Omnitrophota bacterium]HRY84997.1 SDR family oxidoreductase [Candidatus Omnitrophota bacterium]
MTVQVTTKEKKVKTWASSRMMRSLQGITALVTGASSGIGKAMARELASHGAHLILVSRNAQRLEQEAEDLRIRFGVATHVFPADLNRPEKRQELFDRILAQGFTVDLLVNNAGLAHYGPFVGSSLEETDEMLTLNVQALTHLTRLFLPGMIERKKGGVLNVASTAGFQPIPNLSVYAATKAFVLNFSEALWEECRGSGVRIFCLCPGNTLTRFHQAAGIDRQRMFFSASAADVARFGLKKFLHSGRPSGIYGFWNKLMIYAERLSPRRLTVFVTGLMYRSGKKPAV